ncbi:hypothetical protein CLCR_03685 [Cladophialophora carrionii]|uniref:Uncharacterized protein n=1 Tax=Cladophialophora carrionii TaxID=86049 RepID=A0A1C1CGK2_9EURO|nr:hypothetical protein CLCR_03685 [Cladophialophora carrionii]
MVSGGSHFRYSDEVRNLVLVQLAAGVKPSDIAAALGVSQPFISQVKTRSAIDPEILELLVQQPQARAGKEKRISQISEAGTIGANATPASCEDRSACEQIQDEIWTDDKKVRGDDVASHNERIMETFQGCQPPQRH